MNAAAPLSQRQNAVLIVPGMGSDHCTGLVSQSLKRLPDIAGVPVLIVGASPHVSAWKALRNRTANQYGRADQPAALLHRSGGILLPHDRVYRDGRHPHHLPPDRPLPGARAKGRASQAIRKMLGLGAKSAVLLRDGGAVQEPIEALLVGDGINDAPALKQANGGIAVGLLHPMIAMIASSLSVIANSLLLKRAPLSVIRKTH